MPEGNILAPDPLGGPPPGAGGDVPLLHTAKFKVPGSGMVVFGRYKLDRILGRGGMGVVWLAEDTKLERPVALKFLPSLIGLDPAAVRELKIETRRGLELSHPNIVRIYDFVDDEDAAAISMEFVDGKTLSELRMSTEHGIFTVAEVSQWLAGVCEALDYAHFHRQLVHRDLKPANIMVNTHGMAKIADFGIARSLADTMSRLSVAHLGGSGTLPYMSPQQAMGERPLPTDDVYSLAATLYEMLAGKPPFYRGDLPTQITSKIPSLMRERRAELEIKATDPIPPEWEIAIAKALDKDPAMRPASAGAFAELVGLKVPGTATRLFTFGTQTGPAAKPSTIAWKGALAVAAALLATGGIIWWGTTQRDGHGRASTIADQAKPSAAATPSEESKPPPPAVTAKLEEPKPMVEPAAAQAPSAMAPPPPPPPLTLLPVVPPESASVPGLAGLEKPVIGTLPPLAPMATTLGAPAAPDASVGSGTAGMGAPPPVVVPPEAGFWELDEMFPNTPFAAYSVNGKRHLLYRVQNMLKKQGLYREDLDGKPGTETYKAIVVFQVKESLPPSGLLDLQTLTALELAAEADKADWSPPTDYVRRRRSTPPQKPGLIDRVKKMFK